MDPYLKSSPYNERARLLSGFAARTRTGYYGRGKQVKATTVSTALTTVGQTIALECERNPTKVTGSDKLIPRLQQMLDGWKKADPPTLKMLPVEADVPEYIATLGTLATATPLDQAIGDLALIAYYYLLRIGEYTCKPTRNETKQTIQFKMEDLTFFKRTRKGELRCITRSAPDWVIASADGATLKLDNQKNGWKGVCVFQEANGDPYLCPVRALARRYLHMKHNKAHHKDPISMYWSAPSIAASVTAEHMTRSLKLAATMLEYPARKGIPIQRINTHSLRSGGANALALSGYSDTQIQKMGRWRGATFKEYIREELACFSAGMSKDMKRSFQFVNIAGNAFHDVTDATVLQEYSVITPAA